MKDEVTICNAPKVDEVRKTGKVIINAVVIKL